MYVGVLSCRQSHVDRGEAPLLPRAAQPPQFAASSMDLKPYLEQLMTNDSSLSSDQASAIAEAIAAGHTEPHQLSAFLALLHARGETAPVVFGFAKVLRKHATVVQHKFEHVLDIVGTGGDGHNTINISTASAIVAASAGAIVAKHGSISVSSRSGSADVLKELGISMLTPELITPCLEAAGIAFMLAPMFHPALKHVVPVRKALKIRTIFNILGPLLNPAGAKRLLLGVFQPRLLHIYAEAVMELGVEHALVVHSCGLDEFSPVGETTVVEVRGETMTEYTFNPVTELGISLCSISDLEGGGPVENAAILRAILGGSADTKYHAMGQAIAINAGAALYVADKADSIVSGYHIALEKLRSGAALATLEAWSAACKLLEGTSRSSEATS
jgi:anthranilate phosphoribosyltransferase